MNTETRKLRIYLAGSDPDGNRALMPLAGVILYAESGWRDYWRNSSHYIGAYRSFCDVAPTLWEPCELRDADLVAYRYWIDFCSGEDARVEQVAAEARDAGLPCLFVSNNDAGLSTFPSYGMVYHPSIAALRRRDREFALAAPVDDMLTGSAGQVSVRRKEQTPSVGFCGNVSNRWNELCLRVIGKSRNVRGTSLRRRAIRTLERHPHVTARILRRDRFWGGAVRRRGVNFQERERLREQYVQNMLDADYTLCIRGAGNFSLRFYETLSAGRIPLFINTHCLLPFEDEIDWSDHCLIVDQRDLDRLGDILVEYHTGLSDEAFCEMQRSNRTLWERYLHPLSSYQRMLGRLRPDLRSSGHVRGLL